MKNIELGIALLADDLLLASQVHFPADNLLHLSLFQGLFSETKLPILKAKLDSFSFNLPLTCEMVSSVKCIEGNTFWCITKGKQRDTLIALSHRCVDLFSPERVGIMKQVTDNVATLSADQKALIEAHGIHWIKQYFEPHITLAYQTQVAVKANSLPSSVTFNRLAIVELGYHGNALRTCHAHFSNE